jgi:hypothetical protein
MQSFLKLSEGSHLPTLNSADERKRPDAAVRVGPVKHGQPLVPPKTSLTEGPNQRRELCRGEHGLGRDRQRPQVQQRAVKPSLPTRLSERLQGFLARVEIELFIRVETNELARPDDL